MSAHLRSQDFCAASPAITMRDHPVINTRASQSFRVDAAAIHQLHDLKQKLLNSVGRNRNYWLHVEADSTVVRAEIEELVMLLNDDDCKKAVGQMIKCFDVATWQVRDRRTTCGNSAQSAGILRHTQDQVNYYAWRLGTGNAMRRIHLSVSLAGGIYANPFRMARWQSTVGKCAASSLNENSADCDKIPGVGRRYWQYLFASVGSERFANASFPDAMVLNYAHHWSHCTRKDLYVQHVDFWIASLRAAEYRGPVLWRSSFPPRFARAEHPIGDRLCLSFENVTGFDRAVRSTLRERSVRVVEVAHLTEGWGNASLDRLHFDGGLLRNVHAREQNVSQIVLEQPVTQWMLAALLQALMDARVEARDPNSEP